MIEYIFKMYLYNYNIDFYCVSVFKNKQNTQIPNNMTKTVLYSSAIGLFNIAQVNKEM